MRRRCRAHLFAFALTRAGSVDRSRHTTERVVTAEAPHRAFGATWHLSSLADVDGGDALFSSDRTVLTSVGSVRSAGWVGEPQILSYELVVRVFVGVWREECD